MRLDFVFPQVVLGKINGLGGDPFSLEVLGFGDGGFVGNDEDPSGGGVGCFVEGEVENRFDLGSGFGNPVFARETDIEEAVLDVGRNFLGAKEADLNGRIVNRWFIRTAGDGDVEACPLKKLECGFLQTTFGQAKAEGSGGFHETSGKGRGSYFWLMK